MKSTLAIFFLSLISIIANCQTEFLPGYVVKNNKDTLKGYLENTTETNLLKKVKFKTDLNASVQIFSQADISSFSNSGDVYRNIAYLNTSVDNPGWDSNFAKLLVTGTNELYTFIEGDRRFYVVKHDTVTILLYDVSYVSTNEPMHPGNYMSRLNLLANECKSAISTSQDIMFNQRDISNFFVKLNNCLSPGSSRSLYQKSKIVTKVFAYVGLLPLGEQSQFTASAGLRFSSPKISKNTFLNVGLHYSNTVTVATALNGANLPYKSTTIVKVYSLPVTFQYNFFNGRVRPYIYGGFSASYIDDKTNGEDNILYAGVQRKFGLAFVVGGSIEARIVAGLSVKVDYHYELVSQFPSVGLSYQF